MRSLPKKLVRLENISCIRLYPVFFSAAVQIEVIDTYDIENPFSNILLIVTLAVVNGDKVNAQQRSKKISKVS